MLIMMTRSSTRLVAVLTLLMSGIVGCTETASYEKTPDANKEAMQKVDDGLKSTANRSAKAQGAVPKSVKGRAMSGAIAPGAPAAPAAPAQ